MKDYMDELFDKKLPAMLKKQYRDGGNDAFYVVVTLLESLPQETKSKSILNGRLVSGCNDLVDIIETMRLTFNDLHKDSNDG